MPRFRYISSRHFSQKLNPQYVIDNQTEYRDLQDSKRMLSTLVSNLPGMAYRCKNEQNWSMTIVSKGCFALTGYQSDELIGNQPSYENIIMPEYKEMVWQQVQQAIQSRRPFDIAYQIKTKQGIIKDVTEKGIGIYNQIGEVEAIEGFIWDDTQLKQTQHRIETLNRQLQLEIREKEKKQQKILENRRYLLDIIDAVPHMIFIKDNNGKYLLANQSVANAYGKNVKEVIGRDQYELEHINSDELEKFLKDDREVINNGQKKFIAIERFTDKSGIVRSFQTHKLPFNYEGQTCVLGTVVDISQLVETQKAIQALNLDLEKKVAERTHELSLSNEKIAATLADLKQTQEHLIQSEKMSSLARLVSGLAHQINTPIGNALTGVSSLAITSEKLLDSYKKGMKQRDFEEILENIFQLCQMSLQNIEAAATLIKNLKCLSGENLISNRCKFNVASYTQDVILSLQQELQEKNITVQTEIPKDLEISSYREVYGQILTILMMNSVIHAFGEKSEGKIAIKLEKVNDNLTITYSDNGKGIIAADLPHIFAPFYKANLNSSGTGLGLHILYNFITATFKGKVECQSQLGQGVNFLINIPATSLS